MKPFLGIDLTHNKKNEQFNGNEFLIQEPSAALLNSLLTASEKATDTVNRSKLPQPLRVIQYICGITALLFGGGILKSDVSFSEGYYNAPWVFWGAGIGAVIWLILWVWGKLKAKSVMETEDSTQTFSRLDGINKAVYAELGVPGNAKDVDILSFFYKIKDGNIKIQEKGMQIAQYFNTEFKFFADSENLYLANLDGKYAFPLSSVTALRTVKKHIRIAGWNKDDAFNQGIYKQYKLTTDQYGCVHCKYYHILEISHQGEIFGIYIPCYELPVFEELTGLKAVIQ